MIESAFDDKQIKYNSEDDEQLWTKEYRESFRPYLRHMIDDLITSY